MEKLEKKMLVLLGWKEYLRTYINIWYAYFLGKIRQCFKMLSAEKNTQHAKG